MTPIVQSTSLAPRRGAGEPATSARRGRTRDRRTRTGAISGRLATTPTGATALAK